MFGNRNEALEINKEYGISKNGDTFFASLGDSPGIILEKDIAQNISLALRTQDKVDRVLKTETNSHFLKIVAMLNCRQTIFVLSGITSLNSLVDTHKKLDQENLPILEKLDAMEKIAGAQEMTADIDRILKLGRQPIIGTAENFNIREYLEKKLTDLPCVVHIFGTSSETAQDIEFKALKVQTFDEVGENLIRNHTFLVLGCDPNGNFICFHKQGPEILDRFELADLNTILNSVAAKAVVKSKKYISFIGPIK